MSLKPCQLSVQTLCGEAVPPHNLAGTRLPLGCRKMGSTLTGTMSMQARVETGKCCALCHALFSSIVLLNFSQLVFIYYLCISREKTRPDSQRPSRANREDGRPMQPHGQEPSRHKEQERPTGPHAPPRDRDRDHHNPVVWREVSNDKRPKSSYTSQDESPQSPRDKRPLSGPNVRTPHLPVSEGVTKTAQQSRPFNTYPRTESDSARNPSSQVSTKHDMYWLGPAEAIAPACGRVLTFDTHICILLSVISLLSFFIL